LTLKIGFDSVKQTQLLTVRDIQNIQSVLVANDAGFRKQIGTQLINDTTGDIIYTPPQDYQTILNLMSNLENYLNNDAICSLDPLVKMAIIHHQFETIHPFYDGNGRTGRIINILYLVKSGLLDSPIMYLSRYINKNKSEYYRLLQSVRDTGEWEDWIMFILQAVKEIALQTIKVIGDIKNLMQEYKNLIKSKAPKIYSHELLNNIFYHPYTKLEFATKELNIQRKTAMKYLNNLVDLGILEKHKVKRENYYLNIRLFDILSNI
jgi:Fic family protein